RLVPVADRAVRHHRRDACTAQRGLRGGLLGHLQRKLACAADRIRMAVDHAANNRQMARSARRLGGNPCPDHLVSAAPSNTDRRAEELHPAQDEARDPALLARYLKLYGDERMVLERRRRPGPARLPEGSAVK